MTRESVKRLIKLKRIQLEVEEHFANGGEVEVISLTPNSKWQHAPSPTFDWESFDYRIKAQPTHRPFGEHDQIVGSIVRERGVYLYEHLVTSRDFRSQFLGYNVNSSWVSADALLDRYEISFDGGTTWGPAGVPLPKAEQPAKDSVQDPNWKPGNQPE